jgi:hypothetical protein
MINLGDYGSAHRNPTFAPYMSKFKRESIHARVVKSRSIHLYVSVVHIDRACRKTLWPEEI